MLSEDVLGDAPLRAPSYPAEVAQPVPGEEREERAILDGPDDRPPARVLRPQVSQVGQLDRAAEPEPAKQRRDERRATSDERREGGRDEADATLTDDSRSSLVAGRSSLVSPLLGWLWLSGAVQLTDLTYLRPEYARWWPLIRAIEYGPLFALLAWDGQRHLRRAGERAEGHVAKNIPG